MEGEDGIYLFCHCDQTPNRSYFRGKRLIFGSQFEGTVYHGKGGMATGSWLHCICNEDAEKDE